METREDENVNVKKEQGSQHSLYVLTEKVLGARSQLIIDVPYGSNFMTILDFHQSLKKLAVVERLFWSLPL